MAQIGFDYEVPSHLKGEFTFRIAGVLPPQGLLFGFHTVQKVGERAAQLGARLALIVTDATMVNFGYVDLVKKSLEREGIAAEVFGKVEPEPHLQTAETLVKIIRGAPFDLVIGLGGGSCMDVAKVTSLVAMNDLTPRELVTRKKEPTKAGLKKILIPTTAGTGSEASRAMVLAEGKEKYAYGSPYGFPEVAIVDPGLTLTMPPKLTAISGIDALSHAVDCFMNRVVNPLAESIALGAIELIGKYLRRATFNGSDAEARFHMSMAATMGMLSVGQKGSALYSHAMAYVLAIYQPMPHGVACGLSMPYTMAYNLPMIENKLAMIARALGEKIEGLSSREAGRRAAERVLELMADLKLPLTSKELGISEKDLPKMAEICIRQYRREDNPRPVELEDCLAIFQAMWKGSIEGL